jgi:hypothetical protein
MSGKTAKKAEIRKNWVTPQLKKIGIEEITASGPAHSGGFDGFTNHS